MACLDEEVNSLSLSSVSMKPPTASMSPTPGGRLTVDVLLELLLTTVIRPVNMVKNYTYKEIYYKRKK